MNPELRQLRDAEPPPIDRVHRRFARRRARRRWIAGVAAVGVAVLAVVLARPQVRDRGLDPVPSVSLDAVAEGAGPPRALRDGDPVGPEERVVFFVRSSSDGWATIREEGGAAVYPASGSWPIRAGEFAVGGDRPQSWRPDAVSGPLRYELVVCPEPEPSARCGSAGMTLRWTP